MQPKHVGHSPGLYPSKIFLPIRDGLEKTTGARRRAARRSSTISLALSTRMPHRGHSGPLGTSCLHFGQILGSSSILTSATIIPEPESSGDLGSGFELFTFRGGVGHDDPVAAGSLGLVEGFVGGQDQVDRFRAPLGNHAGYAGADGDGCQWTR